MMINCRMLSLLLPFAFAGLSEGRQAGIPHPFALTPKASSPLLDIRGGAGPLDPALAQKFQAVASFGHAVPGALSPTKWLEMNKLKQTPWNVFLAEEACTSLLQLTIGVYCVVFHDTSTITAFAFSLLPWLAVALRHLLEGTSEKVGNPKASDFLILAMCGLGLFCALSGADYADTVIKGICVYNLIAGPFLALFPDQFAKGWGIRDNPSVATVEHRFLARLIGSGVAANGVFFYTLASGIGDSKKAMGYGFIPFLGFLLLIVTTGEADALGIPKLALLIRTLVDVVLFVTLAF